MILTWVEMWNQTKNYKCLTVKWRVTSNLNLQLTEVVVKDRGKRGEGEGGKR